jgi:hypothetical protein
MIWIDFEKSSSENSEKTVRRIIWNHHTSMKHKNFVRYLVVRVISSSGGRKVVFRRRVKERGGERVDLWATFW